MGCSAHAHRFSEYDNAADCDDLFAAQAELLYRIHSRSSLLARKRKGGAEGCGPVLRGPADWDGDIFAEKRGVDDQHHDCGATFAEDFVREQFESCHVSRAGL